MNLNPRGVLIAGNWKMNHGPEATRAFFSELNGSALPSGVQAEIYCPDLSLAAAKETSGPIAIGAQNVHWKESGAFTGEISGPMLKEVGIQKALVGHSERRQYFGETNETTALRTESLLSQGFDVIFCIGETLDERESGQTQAVLNQQLSALGDWTSPYWDGKRLTIAYEPVWAIGTGVNASPEQAEESHQMVRKFLWDRFGMGPSGKTRILYGGSVKPENISQLLVCANVDGALVGGASLKAKSFHQLLVAAQSSLG